MRSFKEVVSLLAAGSAILWAMPAVAQSQAAASSPQDAADGGLEEIVVTAQKRSESMQKVPVAVSAFSAEALQNSNASSLASLQGLVPSLTIVRSGAAPNTPQLSLRGISLQDVEKGMESGIGFVIDGVPLGSAQGALLGAFDVERVEVLRGPQGLLFGRNTTGGTINVVRSRPDPDKPTSGKVRVTLGSFGRNDYDGVVMTPVIDGVLAAKFAISVQKNSGEYRNSVYGGRDGDRDFRDYVFALNFKPTDRLSMLLTLEHQEDDSEIPPFIPIQVGNVVPLGVAGYFGGANAVCNNPFLLAGCRPLSTKRNDVETQPITDNPYFKLDAITLETGYEAGPVRLVSLTGYRKTSEAHTNDFDATRFALFRDARYETFRQFSQELRLESSFGGPFEFVGGAFYFDSKSFVRQRTSVDGAGLAPGILAADYLPAGVAFLNSASAYNAAISSKSFALFFQGEFSFTDRLKLIFGARQTWDRKGIEYASYDPVFGTTRDLSLTGPLASAINDSVKFKKFTPKIGVNFQATRDILVYASYSKGYNAGGFTGRAASAALVGPYQPESMDAYEVGVKTELFDRRVRFNLTGFYNTLKNKQEDVLVFVGSQTGNTTVNAAEAEYKGIEAELTVTPLRGWIISGSTGYLDAKYKRYFGNLGQGYADLSGLPLRRTPEWTGGLTSDYTFAAGPGEMGLNASLQYVDKYQTNVLNDPRGLIPPTARADLAIRYSYPVHTGLNLEVSAFVKNVTDNTTYTGTTSGNSVGTFVEFAIPDPGRTFGFTLGAKF